MLFSAPEFLLAFLPITVIGFHIVARLGGRRWAMPWLIVASLVFYGWWKADLVLLLVGSVAFNYGFSLLLVRRPTKPMLAFGVAVNLAALGWFKYSGFFAETVNHLASLGIPVPEVVLPLGISFYTFQQIAYLADSYADDTHETSFTRYALFVVFFPQLVAGPIVHHREMLPQFERDETYRFQPSTLVLGLTAFGIGLFKKVCIADVLAAQTPLAFGPAAEGVAPYFIDAWLGTIAFALQIYFDFSGYSDMAIGLGLMFGIRLPVNFSSPYRAASIIDFWSRWHMTLTRFLTAYIYNPIAMAMTRRRLAAGKTLFSRSKPEFESYLIQLAFPTVVTMTLAGIWHGAGWTFLIFGVWHGLLLATNHGWRALRRVYGRDRSFGPGGKALGVLLTFVCVVIGHAFFKSTSVDQAFTIVGAMFGLDGEFTGMAVRGGPDPANMAWYEFLYWRLASLPGVLIMVAFAIVYLLPNTPQYIDRISGTVAAHLESLSTMRWLLARKAAEILQRTQLHFVQGTAIGVLFALALLRAASVAPTEFLYFTF